MTLEVVVLGSSGSYASKDNPCSGYLVRTEGACVLLDCGPGTLGPLQREIDLTDLTAVVLTHCHPDHWLELPVLRNVFKYFTPRSGIPVFGTAQTREMDQAVTVHGSQAGDPFDWHTIDSSSVVSVADQTWTFSRTDHPVETLATRMESGGLSVGCTSDTGPGWKISELGPPLDLVFCDASHLSAFEDHGIPHLSAREAGECASEADAAKLVLTHLVPGSDPEAHRVEAEAAYGGPVEIAVTGARFTI